MAGSTAAVPSPRWLRQWLRSALAGAATLLVLLGASLLVPEPWSPWAEPGTPPWGAAHTGWLAALPVLLGLLAYAHRDRP